MKSKLLFLLINVTTLQMQAFQTSQIRSTQNHAVSVLTDVDKKTIINLIEAAKQNDAARIDQITREYETNSKRIISIINEKDPSIADQEYAETALTTAVSLGNINALDKILQLGADPNIRGSNNRVPLLRAIVSQPHAVLVLLRAGATPTEYILRRADTQADQTIRQNVLEKIKQFDREQDQNVSIFSQILLCRLNDAVSENNLDKFEGIHAEICKNNIDSTSIANTQIMGQTLLHIATRKAFNNFIKRIIELRADVNAKDKDNLTPLEIAILVRRDSDIIKTLLEAGAHVTPKAIEFAGNKSSPQNQRNHFKIA